MHRVLACDRHAGHLQERQLVGRVSAQDTTTDRVVMLKAIDGDLPGAP
jgi:hypothetical protein